MTTPSKTRFRWLLALSLLGSCIGCDQATKAMARERLADRPPQTLLADTIRLDLALNSGGFLGMGSRLPERVRSGIFIALNSLMMLGLAAYLCWKRNVPLMLFVPLVCILAGGIGNLIDRVHQDGLVTDFINVGVGPLRTGIFNVADMAITFGALALLLLSLTRSATAVGAPAEG